MGTEGFQEFRESGTRAVENGYPVVDVSFVELPDRVTYRIDAGRLFGAAAFFAMIAVPGTAEENPFLAFILTVVFGVFAHLSVREDGRRK